MDAGALRTLVIKCASRRPTRLGATDAAGAAVLIGLHLTVAVVLILALPAAARGAHGAR